MPAIHSTVLRRMPQSGIEVETRNAGGCGIDWRVEHTPVEKYARLRNTNRRGKQPRILRSEQIAEQVKRFSRNKFAANFMTWKTSAFEQQHGGAAAGRGNGCRSSRRAGADYDQVVRRFYFFQAIAPMRNRRWRSIFTLAATVCPNI